MINLIIRHKLNCRFIRLRNPFDSDLKLDSNFNVLSTKKLQLPSGVRVFEF